MHDNNKIFKYKREIAVKKKLRKNTRELKNRKISIKRLAFLKLLLEKIKRMQKEKK